MRMADMKGDGGGNTAEGFDAREAFADKEREEDTYDDLPPLEYIEEDGEEGKEGKEEEQGGKGSDEVAAPEQAVCPVPYKVATLVGLVELRACPSDPLFLNHARPGICTKADSVGGPPLGDSKVFDAAAVGDETVGTTNVCDVTGFHVKPIFGTCRVVDVDVPRT